MSAKEIETVLDLYAHSRLSKVELGRMFDRDHSTIHYHIVRHGVVKGAIIINIKKAYSKQHSMIPREKQEKPKTYVDYLNEENRRKYKRFSSSFPMNLCINKKSHKTDGAIIDIAVDVIR